MLGADMSTAPLAWEMHHARHEWLGHSDPQCYSSSACSILFSFSLLWGSVGSPIEPPAQRDNFHIAEIQDLCKTHKQILQPQTAPPSLPQGRCTVLTQPVGFGCSLSGLKTVDVSKPKRSLQQCTSTFFFFFPKFILSVLQYSFLLPSTAAINK